MQQIRNTAANHQFLPTRKKGRCTYHPIQNSPIHLPHSNEASDDWPEQTQTLISIQSVKLTLEQAQLEGNKRINTKVSYAA